MSDLTKNIWQSNCVTNVQKKQSKREPLFDNSIKNR